MWIKHILIALLFYFFALLQNSFFVHFGLFGGTPNLVFILFILLVFFSSKNQGYLIVFYSLIGGLILDIFSYSHIGVSVTIMVVLGFLLKKVQLSLFEDPKKPMFFNFLVLFFVSFITYDLFFGFYSYLFKMSDFLVSFNLQLLGKVIYNLFFASMFFSVYKNFYADRFNNRQLSLFKNK